MGPPQEEEGEEGKDPGEGQGERKGEELRNRPASRRIYRGGRRFGEFETCEPQCDGSGRCG